MKKIWLLIVVTLMLAGLVGAQTPERERMNILGFNPRVDRVQHATLGSICTVVAYGSFREFFTRTTTWNQKTINRVSLFGSWVSAGTAMYACEIKQGNFDKGDFFAGVVPSVGMTFCLNSALKNFERPEPKLRLAYNKGLITRFEYKELKTHYKRANIKEDYDSFIERYENIKEKLNEEKEFEENFPLVPVPVVSQVEIEKSKSQKN